MFWRSKTPVEHQHQEQQQEEQVAEPKKKEYCSRLHLFFEHGAGMMWDADISGPTAGYVTPWRQFKTWYHAREGSPAFTISHEGGETTFRRKDIRMYTISRMEK